jgi:hypothetical protein
VDADEPRRSRRTLPVTGLGAQLRPEQTTEFTSDGDLGFVALQPAGQESGETPMQAVLGFPTQGAPGLGLAFLAGGEFLADFGGPEVMLGAFDVQPTRMPVATAGDAAQALATTAGVFGADQPQVGHELARMAKRWMSPSSLTVIIAATT